MPQRRKDFADRIDYRKQAPPPRAQDPLSAMAPLLRVRPEFQAVCRFASQWDAPHDAEPAGWAQFDIVTKGNCLLNGATGIRFVSKPAMCCCFRTAMPMWCAPRRARAGRNLRLGLNTATP